MLFKIKLTILFIIKSLLSPTLCCLLMLNVNFWHYKCLCIAKCTISLLTKCFNSSDKYLSSNKLIFTHHLTPSGEYLPLLDEGKFSAIVSHWLPVKPLRHRHLLIPTQRPPFKHGTVTHLAKKQLKY